MSEPKKELSIPDLKDRKTRKEKTTLVAVGDFLMAQWAERGGVDIVGVGDSLGMTLYGHSTTLPMTVDQMIEHVKAVLCVSQQCRLAPMQQVILRSITHYD